MGASYDINTSNEITSRRPKQGSPKALHSDQSCAFRIHRDLNQVVAPSSWRITDSSSPGPPFENLLTPSAISPASNVPRPLPLQFRNSSGYPLILVTILALTLVTATSTAIYRENTFSDNSLMALPGAGLILMLILTEWKASNVLSSSDALDFPPSPGNLGRVGNLNQRHTPSIASKAHKLHFLRRAAGEAAADISDGMISCVPNAKKKDSCDRTKRASKAVWSRSDSDRLSDPILVSDDDGRHPIADILCCFISDKIGPLRMAATQWALLVSDIGSENMKDRSVNESVPVLMALPVRALLLQDYMDHYMHTHVAAHAEGG
ncbi:hypothetical protein MSG28_012638 [Choristoneura fumiferana]|uniref:Uncharacterized protein n=1 Tax=Choristoneura fumiferana TaxID=7141 RepID=A0ACC0JHA2_CHOFU|nr:hypothetical protein MSG28_012638 [Choristoneura fumiferana]